MRNKRRKIEELKSKATILDVGCGTGEFLHEMQQHGWQTTGLETNERAADYAKAEYGLSVSTSELAGVDFEESSFDVITFWHVLEHVLDPVQTLMIARRILKDDGIILVACPNVESADARFYGSNWVALDAPRHLSHFVPATLARACEKSALEIFKLQPMFLDAIYNCLMSELLVAKMGGNKIFMAPALWIRGCLLAAVSLNTSMFKREKGSAVLYFARKRER